MDPYLEIAQKLSGVSLATLLVLIGIGSYFKIWVWGHELANEKAECALAIAELKAEKDKWQAMTFAATGLAETAAGIAKARQP